MEQTGEIRTRRELACISASGPNHNKYLMYDGALPRLTSLLGGLAKERKKNGRPPPPLPVMELIMSVIHYISRADQTFSEKKKKPTFLAFTFFGQIFPSLRFPTRLFQI